MKNSKWIGGVLLFGCILVLAGCELLSGNRSHQSSSVVQYLYPAQSKHIDTPGIPTLSLPLRVGVAFVPEQSRGEQFSEKQKMNLLKAVSTNFLNYPFVKSIETIPSTYLTPGGGFENLDQLRSMFDVDVIALLSYDQVQFTDEGILSVTYWTIVGAYVIRGEKNDTKTLMDAAVYDISSRKLLFRAPGTSQIKGSATPVNLTEQLRHDSEQGFSQASTNMVANLQIQLEEFKERVKSSPEQFKIVRKPGYTGGGSLGEFEAILIGCVGVLSLWLRKSKRA
jgi:rhombotail lipoprotein